MILQCGSEYRVEPGRNGDLIEPGQPEMLAEKLGELLEAPAILEGMRAAILKKRIDFSARSCARKVYAAVRKSLGSAGEAA